VSLFKVRKFDGFQADENLGLEVVIISSAVVFVVSTAYTSRIPTLLSILK
jgi:hypothetical protein